MSEDQVPEVEMSLPEALGVIDVIYRTQYKGWEKMRAVLKAVQTADVTLTATNDLIGAAKVSLVELEFALNAKVAEAEQMLSKLSDQIRAASANAKELVSRETAAQRTIAAEEIALATEQLSNLNFKVADKQDELNALEAKVTTIETQIVELETRGEAAEARMVAAKQALIDAQAHF